MMKRLEADRFAWPRRQQQAVVRISTEQLHRLLEGIDIEAEQRHPVRQYRSVG
jgi:transposase